MTMKIPTTPSVKKADASLDVQLNPVELGSKEIVSWGVAFSEACSRRAASRCRNRDVSRYEDLAHRRNGRQRARRRVAHG
jgi:hypothetical protein